MLNTGDSLPSTIEIKPARVHVAGKFAGVIEVPIIARDAGQLNCDLGELYLQIASEEHLLRPSGRVNFEGGLQLTFFSKHVRKSGRLPSGLQLHWGDPCETDHCGMELACHKAGPASN